jgi:ribose 5-phosphate isomerase
MQAIVGVMETGLFIGRAHTVFVADPAGVRTISR